MLTYSLHVLIIAVPLFVNGIVVHESRWWAVFIVTVLGPPALFVISIRPWARLSDALSPHLQMALVLSSTGLLGYVAYRSGVSTILICAAAFYLSRLLAVYPVLLVLSLWRNRHGEFDHL
ncbi:hypothetical protein [Micromonospora sp. WMMD964]|uniref:hypothetical protein n=1 Tax=Micromonospora sp. WMMD964 TaxID=3016091 RepID=UPI00249AA4BB|nr:hypothetical protein [Micromonospora sp. WMMD964]WFE98594.1 hypothetical protein O7616_16925 [Micromonospora sp. WMMD964]